MIFYCLFANRKFIRNFFIIQSKVLVLTIYNEAEYLSRAMEIGAQGYVLKDSESVILKRAIFTVYRGENYIDKTMLPVWNDTVKNVKSAPEEKLTRRELEVLKSLLFFRHPPFDLLLQWSFPYFSPIPFLKCFT